MGTGRRLLLADDSITIQKVVNLTFADEGMEVVTVGNGDLAVEKIEDLAPDIVLADIHMPGLNGYEVCEFVKRNARFRHIPVLLLVGSFEPFNEAEARRVGADDYLTKPFQSIRQLVSKVSSLLGGKSAPADEDAPTRDLELPAGAETMSAAQHESGEAPTPLAATMPLSEETLRGYEDERAPQPDAFADPSLDDAMIEATPAGDYNLNRTVSAMQRPTTPLSAADLEEAGINFNPPVAQINVQDTLPISMPIPEEASMSMSEEVSENLTAPAPPSSEPSAHFANATAADDALLDLGEIEPPLRAQGADDFVLDIWDESPAQDSATAVSAPAAFTQPTEAAAVPAADYIEAEVIEEEPLVEAAPVEEAQEEEPQQEAAVQAEPQTESAAAAPVAGSSATEARTGQITLEQLSPEVIETIARRAVEMLSAKVVEQIAWEVVPELAERLIKRRLEEGEKQ